MVVGCNQAPKEIVLKAYIPDLQSQIQINQKERRWFYIISNIQKSFKDCTWNTNKLFTQINQGFTFCPFVLPICLSSSLFSHVCGNFFLNDLIVGWGIILLYTLIILYVCPQKNNILIFIIKIQKFDIETMPLFIYLLPVQIYPLSFTAFFFSWPKIKSISMVVLMMDLILIHWDHSSVFLCFSRFFEEHLIEWHLT